MSLPPGQVCAGAARRRRLTRRVSEGIMVDAQAFRSSLATTMVSSGNIASSIGGESHSLAAWDNVEPVIKSPPVTGSPSSDTTSGSTSDFSAEVPQCIMDHDDAGDPMESLTVEFSKLSIHGQSQSKITSYFKPSDRMPKPKVDAQNKTPHGSVVKTAFSKNTIKNSTSSAKGGGKRSLRNSASQ